MGGPIPEPLGGLLAPIHHLLWEDEQDTEKLLEDIETRIRSLEDIGSATPTRIQPGLRLMPKAAPKPKPMRIDFEKQGLPKGPLPLEPIGGAVPLHSEFTSSARSTEISRMPSPATTVLCWSKALDRLGKHRFWQEACRCHGSEGPRSP